MSRTAPQPTTASQRLLRLPAVLDRVGLRRSRWYDLVAAGDAPQPVRLGERAVAWREDEVADWIADRPRASIGQSARAEADR